MDHHGATGPSVPARWWGPATTIANADVMNQLCRVCGEPAAGFHFGAFTCEGCKSFFGRTYNNLNSVSECKNNSECVINKKNRTSCKACRLRKCLLVGMSKSGSRYGRRSNWFKIHCLLQEQQLQQQHQRQLQQQNQQNIISMAKNPWEFATNAAVLLDIDNNNSSVECTKSQSPPFSVSHRLAKTNESPSCWPSQPSPLTVPHQNTLPYFISPFFQTSLEPIAQNCLLPFLPIRPPLPIEPLVIPSTLSSLHSPTNSLLTPKKETITNDTNKSLDKLKSLGPVQEQPIDLSSAKPTEDDFNEDDNCKDLVTYSTTVKCDEIKSDKNKPRKSIIPLDLRCSKS